jgi:P27 family predicted phage terminase small subunit
MAQHRIPTEIKVAKGTVNVSRVLPNEMKVLKTTEVPEPPPMLNELGQQIWKDVCMELIRNNILASVDKQQIGSYCFHCQIFVDAANQLNTNGYTESTTNGNIIQSAYVGILNTASNMMHKIAQSIGITPSARTKIGSNGQIQENPLLRLAQSKTSKAI